MVFSFLKRFSLFILGSFVVLVLASFWMAQSPMALHFVNQYLLKEYSQYIDKLQNTNLVWKQGGPALYLEKASLKLNDYGTLKLSKTFIIPSFLGILEGKMAVKKLVVEGAELTLKKSIDSLKKDSENSLFSPEKIFHFLNEIQIKDLKIYYESLSKPILPAMHVLLERVGNLAEGQAYFKEQPHIPLVDFKYDMLMQEGIAHLKWPYRNINSLLKLINEEGSDLSLDFQGNIAFKNMRPETGYFRVNRLEGYLHQMGSFLPIKNANGEGYISWLKNKAKLKDINIQLTEGRLKGNAKIYFQKGISLSSSLSLENFDIKVLKDYWPSAVIPETRSWVLENIQSGKIHKGDLKFSLSGPQFDQIGVKDLKGEIHYSDLDLHYFQDFPHIQKIQGKGLIFKDKLIFEVQKGITQNLMLDQGEVIIEGLAQDLPILKLKTRVSGELKEALTLINLKPLEYADKAGLNPKDFKGKVTALYSMSFPLVKELKMENIQLKVNAPLKDIIFQRPILGHPLHIHQGSLETTAEDLNLKMECSLKKWPLRFHFDQNFNHSKNKIKIEGTFSKDFQDILTLPFIDMQGPFSLIGALQKQGKGSVLDLKFDGKSSFLNAPRLNWQKPNNQDFSLSLKGIFNAAFAMEKLDIETLKANEKLKGTLQFKDNTLEVVQFPSLKIGKHNLALDYRQNLNQNLLKLHGKVLDFEKFFIEDSKDAPNPKPLHVDLSLEQVIMGPTAERVLGKTEGFLEFDAQKLKHMSLIGQLKQNSSFKLTLLPVQTLLRQIELYSLNAGEVFRVLGILPNMQKGELHFKGYFDDTKTPAPLQGQIQIQDFSLTEMPLMVRVLSLASLSVADWKRKRGFHFHKLTASLEAEKHMWHLKSLEAKGASINLYMSGHIDQQKKVIDLKGDLAPMNFLNQGLSLVPLFGKLLTGVKGSGLLAARFHVKGPLTQPIISANPLSAFMPGILREIF
jgi:hypothetical protein